MIGKHLVWALALIGISGCLRHCCPDLDESLCRQAETWVDLQPALPAEKESGASLGSPTIDPVVTSLQKEKKDPPATLIERLKLPPALPGAKIPDIKLPPPLSKEMEAALKKYFPPLPGLGEEPKARPGPEGLPLTLADLQKLALTNSPVLRQAAAAIEAAKGAAWQAGLYPNPVIGYQAEEIGPTAGMQGGHITQTITTAGKLGLARDVARTDIRIAEHKFTQAQADVRTQVRAGYFNVLAARKNLAVTRALNQLTDEIYRVLVVQLKVGEVAAYEPMQVRVLALQTRAQLVQAHNRYLAAWKELAAALGLPGLPLTELAGRIEMSIPNYQYESVLARVLTRHSDVLIADDRVAKAQLSLRLAQVMPIPDVGVRVMVQKDNTSQPSAIISGVSVEIPFPLFNRNQGNIYQAQAFLGQASEEGHRVRAELTARLAGAFERYDNNRTLAGLYGQQILPNQVQAFRAVVARHSVGGPVGKDVPSYNDLVTAEQTLVAVITNYLNVLRDQWAGVVEVAGLLQTDDLFQLGEDCHDQRVPDLESLVPLSCLHPCSPMQDARLYGADGTWPAAPSPLAPQTLPPPQPGSPPTSPPEILPLPPLPLIPAENGPSSVPAEVSGIPVLGLPRGIPE